MQIMIFFRLVVMTMIGCNGTVSLLVWLFNYFTVEGMQFLVSNFIYEMKNN